MSPQAQITPIDGYDPVDPTHRHGVSTGVEFDVADVPSAADVSQMQAGRCDADRHRRRIGVRLSPDGQTVVRRELPRPERRAGRGRRAARRRWQARQPPLRATSAGRSRAARNNDCAGRRTASATIPAAPRAPTDADCAWLAALHHASQDCVPLILGQPVSTPHWRHHRSRCSPAVDPRRQRSRSTPRRATRSVSERRVGLGAAAPLLQRSHAASTTR